MIKIGQTIKAFSLVFLLLSSYAFGKTLNCIESCPYFDDFSHRCNYQTRCELTQSSLIYRYCENFDSFFLKCLSEVERITPYKINPYLPQPGCEQRCQYFDSFTGNCLYRTRCEFREGFTIQIKCERWDDFLNRCDSETASWNANVY